VAKDREFLTTSIFGVCTPGNMTALEQSHGPLTTESQYRKARYVSMRFNEDILVSRIFEEVEGKKQSPYKDSREELLSDLNEAYVFFGLSHGMYQTQEMVREFEAQAHEIAVSRFGNGGASNPGQTRRLG
jgi:hypothetical protein